MKETSSLEEVSNNFFEKLSLAGEIASAGF
jgi:hypothetical protein